MHYKEDGPDSKFSLVALKPGAIRPSLWSNRRTTGFKYGGPRRPLGRGGRRGPSAGPRGDTGRGAEPEAVGEADAVDREVQRQGLEPACGGGDEN